MVPGPSRQNPAPGTAAQANVTTGLIRPEPLGSQGLSWSGWHTTFTTAPCRQTLVSQTRTGVHASYPSHFHRARQLCPSALESRPLICSNGPGGAFLQCHPSSRPVLPDPPSTMRLCYYPAPWEGIQVQNTRSEAGIEYDTVC